MDCQGNTTAGTRHDLPILTRQQVQLARRSLFLLLSLALVVSLSGCQVIIGTLLMLQGLPTVDCDFKVKTGETLSGKDKKVVVLCSVPESARAEYGGLNYDIITNISRSLQASKIRMADSQKVATWLDDHSMDLTDLQVADVAKQFNSNYVMLINFTEFSFHEKGSPNLYRGRARGFISVIKIKDENGKKRPTKIYQTVFDNTFPNSQPIPADQEGEQAFKIKYVKQVGEDVGRKFHDYRTEDTL